MTVTLLGGMSADQYQKNASALTAQFHAAQLAGVDWQTAAINLDMYSPEDGEYYDMSEPDPSCECATCQRVEWK